MILTHREGSVIVSFILFFTTPVTTNEGIFELKDAVDKGTIGPYTVGVLKIVQHRDPTTVATITSTAPLPRGENTTKASPGNTGSLTFYACHDNTESIFYLIYSVIPFHKNSIKTIRIMPFADMLVQTPFSCNAVVLTIEARKQYTRGIWAAQRVIYKVNAQVMLLFKCMPH